MFNNDQLFNLKDFHKNLLHKGVKYTSYGHISLEGIWKGYFSNLEWERIYLENQFYYHEPLTEVLLKTTKPVFFWDMTTLEDKKGIIKRRSQICKIFKGLSLRAETDKGQNFLSLGFASNHVDSLDFFLQHRTQISALFRSLSQI